MPRPVLPLLTTLALLALAGAASADTRLREGVYHRVPLDLVPVPEGCPDLAVSMQTERVGGEVRVISTVTNIGAGSYRGGALQQSLVLAVNAQPMHSFDFSILRRGESHRFEVLLPIDERANRFSASLRFDPSVASDRSDRNDDCNPANNSASARLF